MRWLCWLVPVIGVSACHDPTQVSVAISTDLDCAAHLSTAIAEGTPGDVSRAVPSATTVACASGDVGTLVFVPSHGRDDRFAVQVVMAVGVPLESCTPPAFGPSCIVATRSLHYISHTSLVLPIVMRSACRGVFCGDGLTCSNGACTTAEIDPFACTEPAGCTEPPPPPIDAAAPPSDAGIVDAGDAATPLPDAAVPPTTIVSGRRLIESITSDAANVYWTERGDYSMANGGVYRADASGAAVTTITSTRESPTVVVVDGTSVFWAELLGEGIVRAPIGGGAATALSITGGVGTNMTDIGVDDTFVYWNNESVGGLDGLVRRAGKDGNGAVNLAQGLKEGPWRIAVGSTSIAYVTASRLGGAGAVSTIPKTTGGLASVVSALQASASSARVAINGDRIAWATVDNGGSVMARAAGVVSTLASGQGEIASLTASATAVYWVHGASGGPGSLERAAWNGSVRKLAGAIAVPGPLTVNATDVYFVDNKLGEIRRVSN